MTSHPPGAGPPFTVLVVCVGNICRSPLAEQLLRLRLGEGAPSRFTVCSAGLRAVVGAPMDPAAARQLVMHHGDPAGLIGVQLAERHVAAADLVLTMTRGQRDEVVHRYPRALPRTFTLAEFATLSGTTDVTSVQAMVEHAKRARSTVRLSAADDVADPIGAPDVVHAAVSSQIAGLVAKIAEALVAASQPRLIAGDARHLPESLR